LSKYRDGDEVTSGHLYRRVPPRISHWNRGAPTRLVFTPGKTSPKILSAAVAWAYRCPTDYVRAYPRYGVVRISVRGLRRRGFVVRWKREDDPGHVNIWGNFEGLVPYELLDLCTVVLPPNPPIN